jgi:hypothetical protein
LAAVVAENSGNGFLLPEDPLDENSDWVCRKCCASRYDYIITNSVTGNISFTINHGHVTGNISVMIT